MKCWTWISTVHQHDLINLNLKYRFAEGNLPTDISIIVLGIYSISCNLNWLAQLSIGLILKTLTCQVFKLWHGIIIFSILQNFCNENKIVFWRPLKNTSVYHFVDACVWLRKGRAFYMLAYNKIVQCNDFALTELRVSHGLWKTVIESWCYCFSYTFSPVYVSQLFPMIYITFISTMMDRPLATAMSINCRNDCKTTFWDRIFLPPPHANPSSNPFIHTSLWCIFVRTYVHDKVDPRYHM